MNDGVSREPVPVHSNGDKASQGGSRANPERGERDDAAERRRQAERILERNRELVGGTSDGSSSGEESVGVGHTVTSDRSHAGGDYSSD